MTYKLTKYKLFQTVSYLGYKNRIRCSVITDINEMSRLVDLIDDDEIKLSEQITVTEPLYHLSDGSNVPESAIIEALDAEKDKKFIAWIDATADSESNTAVDGSGLYQFVDYQLMKKLIIGK